MKELGLSIAAVTAGTGISARDMSDMLANRVAISNRFMYLLSDYLDVDPDDLTPDEPAMYATTRASKLKKVG